MVGYEASETKNPFCYDYDFNGSPYNPIPTLFPRKSLKYYNQLIKASTITENSFHFHVALDIGFCKYQPQYMYLKLDRESKFYGSSRSLQINFNASTDLDSYTGICNLEDETKFYCNDLSIFREAANTIVKTEWQCD